MLENFRETVEKNDLQKSPVDIIEVTCLFLRMHTYTYTAQITQVTYRSETVKRKLAGAAQQDQEFSCDSARAHVAQVQ